MNRCFDDVFLKVHRSESDVMKYMGVNPKI